MKLKEAEEYYLKAIALKPKKVNAYHNYGNLLKEQERFNEAEEYFLKAIKLFKG